jgi:hypothetical protein
MSEPTVHFFDADRPNDDDVFPVYVYSGVIPRVGDHIHYHVDNSAHRYEGDEPGQIEGQVSKVEIEYRRMGSNTHVLASVYLSSYRATPPRKR